MPLRAVFLTLALALALLATAAPAQAALLTGFEVAPSTKAAGANPDLAITATFTPYPLLGTPPPQPKSITFHLPPGVIGDPFATPKCTQAQFKAAACPANTQVGEVAVSAKIPPGVASDANGEVYNVTPSGGDPARLGAVIHPALGGPLLVTTLVKARASDGGLDSVVPELPRTAAGMQIYTEQMRFTLYGKPPGSAKPFMRNPTACIPATTTVDAVSFQAPDTKESKSSSFTPIDCGALPFAPHIQATVGANGKTARGAKPPVSTVVSQAPGQADQSAVAVTLPSILAPDLARFSILCAFDKALARACPDGARIGTVLAGTPLLAQPLTGSVYLTANPAGGLPQLTIQLDDPIPLRLSGTPEITGEGLKTTFSGLPDVPLTRFELNLSGGDPGAFTLSSDLCTATQPLAVAAAFQAHSGATAAETQPASVAGCTPPPAVAAAITKVKRRKPTVKLRVTAAGGAPALQRVEMTLPGALRAGTRKARRKGTKTTAGTAKLTRDGQLMLTLPAGTRAVTATLRKGAVKSSRKLRRARHPRKLKLLVLLRDDDGVRPPVTLRVKPRRGA